VSALARSRAAHWALAVVVTLGSAYWQRVSGPTHPVRGGVAFEESAATMRLERSHGGEGDQPVRVHAPDDEIEGVVVWRRYPTRDPWRRDALERRGDWLEGALPHQPPAGKIEYQVELARAGERRTFPAAPAVTRFKGDVSPWALVPHVLAMFAAMLLSTRAGIGAAAGFDMRRIARWTVLLIAVGGFAFGPLVQKQAFDAWWTGVPYGHDLTDNKTLIAGVAWMVAAWRTRRGRGRLAIVSAAIVTLAVFVVPHSVWGSQLDWDAADS
jgi:hypothetical protein